MKVLISPFNAIGISSVLTFQIHVNTITYYYYQVTVDHQSYTQAGVGCVEWFVALLQAPARTLEAESVQSCPPAFVSDRTSDWFFAVVRWRKLPLSRLPQVIYPVQTQQLRALETATLSTGLSMAGGWSVGWNNLKNTFGPWSPLSPFDTVSKWFSQQKSILLLHSRSLASLCNLGRGVWARPEHWPSLDPRERSNSLQFAQ